MSFLALGTYTIVPMYIICMYLVTEICVILRFGFIFNCPNVRKNSVRHDFINSFVHPAQGWIRPLKLINYFSDIMRMEDIIGYY